MRCWLISGRNSSIVYIKIGLDIMGSKVLVRTQWRLVGVRMPTKLNLTYINAFEKKSSNKDQTIVHTSPSFRKLKKVRVKRNVD